MDYIVAHDRSIDNDHVANPAVAEASADGTSPAADGLRGEGSTAALAATASLSVMVCAPDGPYVTALCEHLVKHRLVVELERVRDLAEAKRALRERALNVVFMWLDHVGIFQAVDFIFAYRRKQPEIVFVLCLKGGVQRLGPDFLRGERRRLAHYYNIDIDLPLDQLPEAIEENLQLCLMDLAIGSSRGFRGGPPGGEERQDSA